MADRPPEKIVAYCKKGADCGNPYEGGKFYYAAGFFVDGCPRCGGSITHNPEYVAASRPAADAGGE